MALTVFSEITPLPERASGTKPDADGELWNTRYTEVNLNFELLEGGSAGEFWQAGGGWSVPAGTGVTNGHVIQDEGTPLTQRGNLDFIGPIVQAADGGTATEVTINGDARHPVKYIGKTAAPTVSDDGTAGYLIGDRWIDETNDAEYVCLDIATGAAVWAETTASGGGGSGVAFKNLLINGDFRINQRGYVSAATLAAGEYGHDRWKAGAGGGDYSFTQLDSSTVITIASGKTLIQVVEDVNVQGGDYVLSWEGTAQARYAVDSDTPTGSYASSPITITGQSAGTTMSVEFDDGTLSNVQLEAGTSATDFEHLPYDVNILRCFRYFLSADLNGMFTYSYQTYLTAGSYSFPVLMRSVPTASSLSNCDRFTVPGVAYRSGDYSLSVLITSVNNASLRWSIVSGDNFVIGQVGIVDDTSGTYLVEFSSEL